MKRKIIHSSDPNIRRMTEVFGMPESLEKDARKAGLRIPPDPKGGVRWRHLVQQQAESLNIGRSVKSFYYRESNTWMNPDEKIFSEADFITGIALRSNTYPCKATLARGQPGRDVTCRHCHLTAETIGHISGHCFKVKNYRIKRHNIITDCLADKMKELEWTVAREPVVYDREGRRWIPDIIAVKGPRAVVIDPTVVYEDGQSLYQAAYNKREKYEHLTEIISEKYETVSTEIFGLAVGARGGWCEQNDSTLNQVGIESSRFRSHLCRLALRGTINMLRLFMDG
jgi:hypothetical protein